MSDSLPGYDQWKTRTPDYLEEPKFWTGIVEFGCGACDHEFEATDPMLTNILRDTSQGFEAKVEAECPECGAGVHATVIDEPDWDSIRKARLGE